MTLMAEPVPAADDPVGLHRAETVAVPNYAASDTGDRTSPHDHGDATTQSEAAPDRQSWRATWRKAGALLAGCLALAGAIVLAFWLLGPQTKGSRPPPGSPPAPTSGAATSPPASATASAPATATSTIASTPDQDDKYIQALNDRGISFANPEAAVYNGKLVCDDIRQGMTVPQIVAAFRASNPALGGDADAYVSISVHAYCPQNANLVGGGP